MLRQIFLTLVLGGIFFSTHAQNISPYWSLAGNSNASASSKLGTTNLIPLHLLTNNAVRATIATDGNVGIGTTTPQKRLHVEGTSNQVIFVSTSSLGASSGSGIINYVKATPTASGQRLGYFQFGSRGGAQNAYNVAGMAGYAGAAWSSTSRPTYLTFETTPAGSTTRVERLRIDPSGNVGIGISNPQFPLDVAGRIRLHSSGGGTAGLWLNNFANTSAIGFMGASDDNHIGLWANLGGFWGLTMNTTNGNVGIGSPADYPLQVSSATANTVILGRSTKGNSSAVAIRGEALNVDGYGVQGDGGHIGVYGVNHGGGATGETYGVLGYSSGTAGTRMGVRGYAEGGAQVYGVFGFAASGGFNAAGYFSGAVWASSYNNISDRKFKQDIVPLDNALQQVIKLRPTSYQFKTAEYKGMNLPKGRQLGLIADEVKEIFPELVQRAVHPAVYDENDRTKVLNPAVEYDGVNYQGLIPVLVASVQELKAENDELKARLEKLETLLNAKGNTALNPSIASLGQNIPNPSRSLTTIPYGIPDGTISARLILVNAKGQTLKEVNITGKGSGQVKLDTAALPAGTYTYSLLINGREADSKQMVITR